MSSGPRASAPPAKRPAVTLSKLAEKKALGEPIVMITAYDYPSAQVAEAAAVDVVLVGDSGAMTVLGYPSTVPVSLEEMLMLAGAARRGLTTPMLVGDLPFGSYEASDEQAIRTARRDVGRARAGDRRRRHPGDGPRRPHAADGDRARRLPLAGPHGRAGARGHARRARARGGGLLRDRVRGRARRAYGDGGPADRGPGDRDRRGPRHGRPGARVPRPARNLRRPCGAL